MTNNVSRGLRGPVSHRAPVQRKPYISVLSEGVKESDCFDPVWSGSLKVYTGTLMDCGMLMQGLRGSTRVQLVAVDCALTTKRTTFVGATGTCNVGPAPSGVRQRITAGP